MHSLNLLAAVATTIYLSAAWNNTPFPLVVFRMLTRLGFKSLAKFGDLGSRQEFEAMCALVWSFPEKKIGHWLSCPICNAWAIALFASTAWLITNPLEIIYGVVFGAGSVTLITLLKSNQSTQLFAQLESTDQPRSSYDPVKEKKDRMEEDIRTAQSQQASPAPAAPVSATPTQPIVSLLPATDAFHSEMGMELVPGTPGKLTLRAKDANSQQLLTSIMRFFSHEQPCYFVGCEQLRAKFQTERAAVAAGGCPTCADQGELLRKYILLVKDALAGKLSNEAVAAPSHSPSQIAPGSAA